MIPLSDLHVHSNFCDGKDTVLSLCRTAGAMGFDALGISGHGYTPFDTSYCMQKEHLAEYVRTVRSMQEHFAPFGLSVFLGVEKDLYGEGIAGADYTIHSVHYVKKDDVCYPVDESPAHLKAAVSAFGEDPYALCEAYFRAVEEAAFGAGQILGHMDLIAKFNHNRAFWDEDHPRYRTAAVKAAAAAAQSGKIVEVNLGAYRKGLRTVPYPAPFLMKTLFELQVPVLLTGDTHRAEDLGTKYEEGLDYIRSFGYRSITALSSGGLQACPIG